MNVNLEKEYERQVEITCRVDELLKTGFRTEEPRHLMAMACFDLAVEHHAAILVLYNEGLYGSAFALVRILFEALVRGMYLLHVATEEDLKKFSQEKLNKNFGEMIEDVETKIDFKDSPLSKLKNDSYKMMNSFTHTGFQHLVRRSLNNQTGAINYSDEDKLLLLACSGSLMLLAVGELSSLADDKTLQDKVLVEIKKHAEGKDKK